MTELQSKIPEIQISRDPVQIPWEDSVVWINPTSDGGRVYEWLDKEHIQYVTWTNGNLSVTPSSESILSSLFHSIIIQGIMIFVGKNVRVG